ncbi:hypothetical protein BGZ58_008620 [Dissophora ornata]|nr:hypothetical protein BGZ58_008620 [Dissophora ornata]
MSTTEKAPAPAPLDPFGNEICLLFLKYGKCRYKKKCKKSHILPDKNAPIMQQITHIVEEQPLTVKSGPKIAFSVRKTPYPKPSSATFVSAGRKSRQTLPGSVAHSETLQEFTTSKVAGQGEEKGRHDTDLAPSIARRDDVESTVTMTKKTPAAASTAMTNESQEVAQLQEKQRPKTKAKRPAKTPSKCLLASLFRTTIPDAEVLSSRRQYPVNSYEIVQQAIKDKTGSMKSSSKVTSKSKPKSESSTKPTSSKLRISTKMSTYSTNESGASGEKVEQWYITNKARLEPLTRRLIVLSKPTTVRQRGQLKMMRKHHWQCRSEIEQQLKRNMPMAFSLRVVKSRIDWDRITPYITLMIQAAFEMDIEHEHLPVIGTTLCTLLEHKDLGGLACEELLVSWGLSEINARRLTSHVWE